MEVLLSEVQQELISDICMSERRNQSVMELWKRESPKKGVPNRRAHFLHENKAVYSDFYEQSYILGRYYIKTQHNISCNGKSGSMLLIQLKYKGTASILPKSFYTIGKDTYKYEFDDFSSDAIDERHKI